MKIIPSLAVLTMLALPGWTPGLRAADDDGIALAIVYDTSGSMKELVRDQDGKFSPKYIIANRALANIATQLQAFTTNNPSGTPKKINSALFVFKQDGAQEAIPFGPFDPQVLWDWAAKFSTPDGGTPLGTALNAAARTVLASPLTHKHVLVITDGNNTLGPAPAAILPQLKQQAAQKNAALSVHFVAFDVDAKVFDSIKKQGATVVGAANEAQLNTQLDFILQRKILLEDETPVKK